MRIIQTSRHRRSDHSIGPLNFGSNCFFSSFCNYNSLRKEPRPRKTAGSETKVNAGKHESKMEGNPKRRMREREKKSRSSSRKSESDPRMGLDTGIVPMIVGLREYILRSEPNVRF